MLVNRFGLVLMPVLIWFGLAGLVGCRPSDAGVRMFQAAPDFALEDLDGRLVRLSDYKGKPILLSFWAIDCGACRAELPTLIELHKRYAEKGLNIVAVELGNDEARNKVAEFVKKQQIPYQVLIQGNRVAGDKYHVRGLPSLVWIDRGFRIRERMEGFNAAEAARELAKMADSAENLLGG
jgi:thiol-disulfide isomerase/thioredoxin